MNNIMKPFNLEKALAGEPVVDEYGKLVKEIHKFPSSSYIFGVPDGQGEDPFVLNYHEHELFMAPKTTKYYIHVYKIYTGDIRTSCHMKKTWDEYCSNPECDLIKSFEFEIEQ